MNFYGSYACKILGTNKSPIYRVCLVKKKEVTTDYSLIPKIKENNMDLELQV